MNDDCKIYKVKLTGIGWDTDGEDVDLPEIIDEFTVETNANPYDHEHWSGWDLFGEHIVDELTEIYGFCVNYLDDIEILGIETEMKEPVIKTEH